MTENEFIELAAGYALDALSPEDEARYRAALEDNPQWNDIALAAEATAAQLAMAVPEASPPASIRDSLLTQIASTPQESRDGSAGVDHAPASVSDGGDGSASPPIAVPEDSTGTDRTSARASNSWRRRWFALAASIALLVGVAVASTVIFSTLNRPAAVVALEEVQAAGDAAQASTELPAGGSATAHWSASLETAVLVTTGLEQLEPNKSYELWLVRGDTPLPSGVFTSDADGQTTAVLSEPLRPGDVIAVTIEDAGGSPTGLPTTDPIIVIETS